MSQAVPLIASSVSWVGVKVSEGQGANTEKESHGGDSDSLVAAVWRRTLCGLREGVQQLISNVYLGHRIAAKEPAEQCYSLLNKYKLLLWVFFLRVYKEILCHHKNHLYGRSSKGWRMGRG